MSTEDERRAAFYANPANLRIVGPGRKRARPRLTSMVPVRFTPEVIERIKGIAHGEGITVSAWIRRAVAQALERRERERPTGLIPGSARLGEQKALTSSLSLGTPRTFSCPHISVGNVTSASCGVCGPMRAAG